MSQLPVLTSTEVKIMYGTERTFHVHKKCILWKYIQLIEPNKLSEAKYTIESSSTLLTNTVILSVNIDILSKASWSYQDIVKTVLTCDGKNVELCNTLTNIDDDQPMWYAFNV